MLKEQRFNFRINQISRNVCALGAVNKIVPKRSWVLLWYSLVSWLRTLVSSVKYAKERFNHISGLDRRLKSFMYLFENSFGKQTVPLKRQ